jgi:colanic acid/amylovoran biosynthesis protein
MKKKINIGIIWATPYATNLGVSALAYSSISLLNDVVNENAIYASFIFLGSSKSGRDQIVINDKQIYFNNTIWINFFKLRSIISILFRFNRYKLTKILTLDYIFDTSSGDSFTDIYGNVRFQDMLNSKRLLYWLGKKLILLPQTIGPFNDPANEIKAFKILKKLNTVMCRDKQSFDYCSRFLLEENIFELIDVAFYLPYTKHKIDNNRINVGINISGLLWNGGYTKNNQFKLRSDYKKLMMRIVSYFIQLDNVQVHLIAHVIDNNYLTEDDSIICEELKNEYQKAIIVPSFNTPIQAKNYISGLDFFIGARMHACIAAFSSGVPVFPMAYSRKFNGLFTDTLQYKWIGDCINENEDQLFLKLREAYINRESLKEQIFNANEIIVKPRLRLLKNLITETLKR